MKKITFAALAVPLMWVLLLLLFFNSNKIHAQETMVLSGVVKSADGTPIEGVTVWQKDTDNGTQTNDQGFYTINISPNAVIVFEYIGYKTQTVKASGSILNVTLTADDDTLEELVINAGYYSVKDKERTGSISKITSKEIGKQPVANPLAAMQGRMAGVNITQSSGTPGGGFDIQIRGRNSLRTEGNAPLYIVDGVPFPSQSASDMNLTAMLFPSGNTSPLNSINPNDIESIEVLKDADATAIYGSRGSNGVVLITTKKGSADKTTFSVQSTTSVSTVSKFMDLMDTQQYLKVRSDAFANDGITEYPANAYDINGTWDQNRYTDWQREFIGGKAVSHNTQFSVGGGSGRTSYLLSAGHRTDGTVYMGDFGYKRTNFLLNVNHKSANDRFDLQVSVHKSNQNNRLMANDLTGSIFLAPNAPALYDAQRNLNWENNTFDNPAAKLNSKYFSKNSDYTANINLSYNLLKNLHIGVSTGFSDASTEEIVTVPHTVYSPAYNYTSRESAMTKSSLKRSSWIVEPKVVWNVEQGNNAWNVVAGATLETREQQAFSVQGGNFSSNDLIMNLANAVNKNILNDSETLYKYIALYGRLNYKYMDRYIVNLTGRRDGSSRFGPNNRFANFGAVGAAWLFSREKQLENSSWLNFGKLRASYGITGSDLIGDYQYLNAYRISHNRYDGNVGLEPARLYNPDFSWETNKKLEAALELEFFNGRLAASVAWYRNRSSNQLVGIPLPGTTGFSSVQANLGALVENSGWEITLRSLNVEKENFKWSTDINLSLPKNKLLEFPNLEESTYALQYEVGYPVFIQKVYHITGVDPETGLYQVEDRNGDGVITSDDRSMIMHLGQKYHMGITNQLNYKNFSLDFLVQFVKQTVRNPDYNAGLFGAMNNSHTRYADYFQPDNQGGIYQMPTTGANRAALQATDYLRNSNLSVSDGSFIRLKSVQLQYQLPQRWFKGTQLVYLQGYNLFTLTKFWGSDPETATGYLPALRTIAVGASLNF